MSTRGHRKNQYKKGAIVERHIEGSWFLAEVLEIDVDELTLRYLDDDNIEKYVHIDEIRMAENECILSDYKPEKKSTLPKPLLGLVDDDSAERSAHQPKVIRHSDIEIGSYSINVIYL
jgi:hypothetical protein